MSKPTGSRAGAHPRFSAPSTSTAAQPGLGECVMCPYVGLCRSRSTGPNVATPSASNGRSACCAASQSLIRGSVSSGVVVGKSARVTMRSGSPTATAATHVVPPPSTPAKTGPRRRAPEDGKPSELSASVGYIAADASSTASTPRACRNGENAFVAQEEEGMFSLMIRNVGSGKIIKCRQNDESTDHNTSIPNPACDGASCDREQAANSF